jgi:predicted dehydrogenase
VLKVGIAGYGIVGKRRHDCLDRNPHTKVVAVCDRNFDNKGKFSNGINFYTTYQELIREKLDVLFVCMTNDIAPEATIAGLNKNLHVFCEKPPGRNLEDIANVIRFEREKPNSKLMYGFNHRYHDSIRDALKVIKSGKLGKIINLRGVYGKSKIITFNQPDWRTQRSIAGGGVLLDQGIHMVDLMRTFAGEFIEVQSFIENSHWNYDVEDNAYALMKTEDGVVGMLNSSATQWRHRFNLDINLQKGSLILSGILSSTKSYGAETLTVASVNHDSDNGDPFEQITHYNNDPSWDLEVEHFTRCINEDLPIENGSSQEAFNTMKLVSKIYYSDTRWRAKFNINNPEDIKI